MRILAIALLILIATCGSVNTALAQDELQGLRRPASGLHEELRGPDLQVRVSDVHEVLQEMTHNHHRLIALRRRVSAAASASSQFRKVMIFGRFDVALGQRIQ